MNMAAITAALAVALGVTGWLLKGAWEDNATQEVAITRLEGERDDAIKSRDDLDSTVTELRTKARQTDQKLAATVKSLNNLKGDSDAFKCLDVSVPAGLDGLLNDRSAKGDHPGNAAGRMPNP